jgi:hypothetical protein
LLEGLVQQAGGALTVRSRPAGGTSLTLELPAAPPRARSGDRATASPEPVPDDLEPVAG